MNIPVIEVNYFPPDWALEPFEPGKFDKFCCAKEKSCFSEMKKKSESKNESWNHTKQTQNGTIWAINKNPESNFLLVSLHALNPRQICVCKENKRIRKRKNCQRLCFSATEMANASEKKPHNFCFYEWNEQHLECAFKAKKLFSNGSHS